MSGPVLHPRHAWWLALAALGCHHAPAPPAEPQLVDAGIFVKGVGVTNQDCRSGICAHNENTDLIRWNGAIFLVHRTAEGQILGPDSSLRIYRSVDEGQTFTLTAVVLAPDGNGGLGLNVA